MNEISIRKLERGDYEEFARLRTNALKTDPTSFWNTVEEESPGMAKRFAERVIQENNFTLGAFIDSEMVGMMAFVRQSLNKLRHRGDIYGVYVHPEHRGKGISSLLLSQTLDQAFAQTGLTKVMLTVTDGNTAAKALYEKYGFISFGTEENGMVVEGIAYAQHHMQIAKEDWIE